MASRVIPVLIFMVSILPFLLACGDKGGGSDVPDITADVTDIMEAGDLSLDEQVDVTPDPGNDTPPGPDDPPYVRHVNPFIGTGGGLANVGSAYPGAAAPLGLVKVSPDTSGKYGVPAAYQHCAGYWYPDDFILGFTHNHLHGTGAPDYGNILVMPTVGMSEEKTSKALFRTPFSHDDEEASPGYYTVTLDDPSIRVEITATTHCAHHRYEFLDSPGQGVITLDAAAVMLDGRSRGGKVVIDPDEASCEGRNWNHGPFSGRHDGFDVYFAIRFNRSFLSHGTWLDGVLSEGSSTVVTETDPANFGAWFEFDTDDDRMVEIQVCLSYVGVDGAREAMAVELPAWDFEGTHAATEEAWEQELGLFEVEGGTPDEKVNFYTAVYHVLQMPTIWTDVDGRYRGFDRKVHQTKDWTYYTDISMWDTFRTQHPLLALVWPQRQRDMVRSLDAMREQGGFVPKWPMGMGYTGSMIGQHGATVITDTYLKGITDYDINALYESMKQTANQPGGKGDRDCFPDYIDNGYCVAGKHSGAVSKTLEYAFNDYCLAELASALGKNDDAAAFMKRAVNYKTLWDTDTMFFRPRINDGSFIEPFSPEAWDTGDLYTEGSAWQWLWFVPHDEAGLRGLFGSDDAFIDKLKEFFELADENFNFLLPSSWYFHGNEPDMHAAFMFIRAGRPDLAQKWSRWILDMNYKNAWDGLVGNDDAGTLAAWYVFAASGLYPWPCFPGYYVTSPLFDRIVIHLPGGDLEVNAAGASSGKVYVKDATWNGTPLTDWWLSHEDVAGGGVLDLTMSAESGVR